MLGEFRRGELIHFMSTVCGGSSQSYANGDWTSTVANANQQVSSGKLPTGKEIVRASRPVFNELYC